MGNKKLFTYVLLSLVSFILAQNEYSVTFNADETSILIDLSGHTFAENVTMLVNDVTITGCQVDTVCTYTGPLVPGEKYIVKIQGATVLQITSLVKAPSAPKDVTIGAATETSLTVSWQTDSGSRQDSFVVEHQDGISEPSSTANVPIMDGAARSHVIQGLKPGHGYIVGVKAVSYGTVGPAAAASEVAYTVPAAPNITSLAATDTKTMTVKWTPDADSIQSSFQVQCKMFGDNTWLSVSCSETGSACTIDMEALFGAGISSGAQYAVRVCAIQETNKGCSEPVDGHTQPKPVTGIILHARTVDSLTVRWSSQSNTVVSGHKIQLGGKEGPWEASHLGGDLYQVVFTGLVSGNQYTIQIATQSGSEQSGFEMVQYYTMPPKPTEPKRVDTESTATQLTVIWDKPGPSTAAFEKYQINISKFEEKDIMETKEVLAGATRRAVFVSLTPGAQYTVGLGTVISSVASDSTTAHFYTKPLPPGTVRLLTRSTDNLSLTWGSPAGEYDKYKVKVMSDEREVMKGNNPQGATFSDLQAGSKYEVTLYSISGDQESERVVDSFYTAPDPPTNLRQQTNTLTPESVTVEWDHSGTSFDGYVLTLLTEPDGTPVEAPTELASSLTSYSYSGLQPSTLYRVILVATVNETINSTETTITFITKPKQPGSLKYVTRSETSIHFTWEAPNQVVQVDRYEYTLTKEGAATGPVTNTTQLEVRATGLTQGALYTIRVTAVKTAKSDTETLQVATVPASVISVAMGQRNPTSVKVMWGNPPQGSVFDGFEVSWSLSSQSGPVLGNVSIGAAGRSHIITDLTAGKTYTVTVKTTSNQLTSVGKSIDIATLSPSVAGLTPQEVLTNSIKVSWQKPTGDVAVNGYELRISPNDANLALPVNITEPDQGHEYVFNGLFAGRSYTLDIVVVSDAGRGASVTTNATTKPLPVEQLEAQTTSTTEIQLSWQRPANSEQTRFLITHGSKQVYVAATGDSSYSKTIVDLQPGSTTTFTVQPLAGPENDNTEGQTREVTQTTDPLRVSSLSVEILGSSSARLTWKPDPRSSQDRYQVRYMDDHNTSKGWSDWMNATAQSKEIGGLFPGYAYNFEIVVHSRDRQSTPINVHNTTYPLPPKDVTVERAKTTKNSVEVSWQYDRQSTYVTAWNVTYTVRGTDSWNVQPGVPLALNTITTVLSNLVSGQNYTVQVYSLTEGGLQSQTPATGEATVKPVMTSELSEVQDQTTTNKVTVSYTEPTGEGVFDKFVISINATTADREQTMPSDSVNRVVSFPGLTAGTQYQVSAMTVSGLEQSESKSIPVSTVPLPPTLRCNAAQYSIDLHIMKPAEGLVDTYNITCNGTSCKPTEINYIGADTSHRVSSLTPHLMYLFKVTSVFKGKESNVTSFECITGQSAPGDVSKLKVVEEATKPFEVTLQWESPRQTNGEITAYFITYIGKKTERDNDIGEEIRVDANTVVYRKIIKDLKAGFTYVFKIWAKTVEEGSKSSATVTTPISAPFIVDGADFEPVVIGKLEWNKIELEFTNPFNERNGEITGISVIVVTDGVSQGDSQLDGDIKTRWQSVQDTTPTPPYAAVYKCADFFRKGNACWDVNAESHRRRRKRAAPAPARVTFTLGGDTDCAKDSVAYCNGPLQPSTVYRVFVRAYTENGLFADGIHSKPIRTIEKSFEVLWIIIIVVVAVVVLLLLFIVLIVLRRKQKICKTGSDMDEMEPFPIPLVKKHVRTSHAVRLSDFSQHVDMMAADTDLKFSAEYEDLKLVGKEHSCVAAELQVNRAKNRFVNILPHDHSRVKLLPTDDEEGSDYINANWMPGYNSKREFIVSQGPLPSTRDDFWRMIWEYNCRAMVMLTKCVEKGREKCDYYWPLDGEPMFYGDLQVSILNEIKNQEYTTHEFKISQGEQSRHITHYHYLDWPDFGVPERPHSLLHFVRMVRKCVGTHGGPIVVHCSAGVGRSGTFIVLDRILQQIKEQNVVDIFGIVYEMRKYRPLMVQTEQQYICIHQCLRFVMEGKEHEEPPQYHKGGSENPSFEEDEGIEKD